MKMTLKEVQECCTEMLSEVVSLCEKNNVPYFMFYGSLIGTIRHQGSIPWDSDVDIAVPECNQAAFLKAMEHLPDKYWVDYRQTGAYPRCFARIGLKGYDTYWLHIDVYRLMGYSGSTFRNRIISNYGHLLIRMRLVKTVDDSVYFGKKRMAVKVLKVLLKPISINHIIKSFDKLCTKYPFDTAPYVGTQDGIQWIIPKRCVEGYEMKKYENLSVRVPKGYDEALTLWYGDYMTPPDDNYVQKALKHEYEIKVLT